MKKSIAILLVLVVSLCAFAGNNKPLSKVPKNERPPVKIEKRLPGNMKLKKPAEKPKKVIVMKPLKRK